MNSMVTCFRRCGTTTYQFFNSQTVNIGFEVKPRVQSAFTGAKLLKNNFIFNMRLVNADRNK